MSPPPGATRAGVVAAKDPSLLVCPGFLIVPSSPSLEGCDWNVFAQVKRRSAGSSIVHV